MRMLMGLAPKLEKKWHVLLDLVFEFENGWWGWCGW
jgi:hypothetical protein